METDGKECLQEDAGSAKNFEAEEKIIAFFKKSGSWIYYTILAAIIWIGVNIRLIPMKINPATGKPGLWDIARGSWTLGPDLDPFLFLRYAKQIAAIGDHVAIDAMRYVPLGYDTAQETTILPHMIASLHKILNLFGEFNVEYAAILLPVVVSIFTAVFFFLFVRKVFEIKGEKISNIIAIIATALLNVLPIFLPRTIAGIPEKESIGFCLMFAAFYFFLSAWKVKKIAYVLGLSLLAGAVTAVLGNVWGGVVFIYVIIAIVAFIAFAIEKVEINNFVAYSVWLTSSILILLSITSRVDLRGVLTGAPTGLAIAVWFFMLVYFALIKSRLGNLKILHHPSVQKIPRTILAMVISFIALFVLGSIIFDYQTIINIGIDLYKNVAEGSVSRIIFTVAENKRPYFGDLKSEMGPFFQGIPLFFWLFFAGSVFLCYEMIGKLNRREKIILTGAFAVFLAALIFNSYSPSSILNGENSLSKAMNLFGYVVLVLAFCYVAYKRSRKHEMDFLKNIIVEYAFVLAFVLAGILATRQGIRFVMVLVVAATIPAAYLAVKMVLITIKSAGRRKIICLAAAILIILSLLYTFNAYYINSKGVAVSHIPSLYTQQWQYAMKWVSESTPKDAVFGHWWDYGYWVQSMGERATMLDGGNVYGYWNYLMGRHVLTAETEEEALEVLYNHNVTYFLIDSTDIGKYSAYSLIGSDEKNDRHSWINSFFRDDKQTIETKNQVIIVYTGGSASDEDIIYRDKDTQIALPGQNTGIAALLVYKNKNGEYKEAYLIAVYDNKQYRIPLRYIFAEDNLTDLGENWTSGVINGAVYAFPKVDEGRVDFIGAALYLSPKNMRAFGIRLYLFNQAEHFELVHSEPSYINSFLSSNGINAPGILHYQGVQGPIKIWKIKYTGKEKVNQEYTQTFFPERIKEREFL